MTNIDQQIAIGAVCGWTHTKTVHNPDPSAYGRHPIHTADVTWDLPLPDYLNDLNAMHEAVMSLDFEQRSAFRKELQYLVAPQTRPIPGMATKQMGYECYNNWFHTTAAQLAEAFLRTLNLWKD